MDILEEKGIIQGYVAFYNIKALFEATPEIDIHPKRGGRHSGLMVKIVI